MDPRKLRRDFAAGLLTGLRVVWPILSALLVLIVALGLVIGVIEGWSVHESDLFRVRVGADHRLRRSCAQDTAHAGAGDSDRGLRCVGDCAARCDCREGVDGGN